MLLFVKSLFSIHTLPLKEESYVQLTSNLSRTFSKTDSVIKVVSITEAKKTIGNLSANVKEIS